MIIDAQNRFSNAQTVTTGSDTGVLATNVIDLGSNGRDLGAGERLFVVVEVTTALEGAGDTCDVELVSDSVETLNSSLTVHQVLGTFAATAAAGTRIVVPIPPATYERYLGLRYYARGSGPLSAGAFTAFLTKDANLYKAYADNSQITL